MAKPTVNVSGGGDSSVTNINGGGQILCYMLSGSKY